MMALTKLTTDVQNISRLSNYPTDEPAMLKSKFDKAGADIKNYINNILTPELDTLLALAGAYPGADVAAVISLLSQSRRNLLHNWDFRNPVNQRGASSYINAVYGIDRWKASTGMVVGINTTDKCLDTTANTQYGLISQALENYTPLLGKTVTISAYVKGPAGSRCGFRLYDFVANASLTPTQSVVLTGSWQLASVTVTVAASASSFWVLFYPGFVTGGSTCSIQQIKLEIGSASTLAYDPPADYGEQLARCQRYALSIEQYLRLRASNITADYIDFWMPIPVSMRVTPSIASGTFILRTLTGADQTGFTFASVAVNKAGLIIRATKTAHGLTDASLLSTTAVVFSADL